MFREFVRTRGADEPTWRRVLRQQSFDYFERVGFPSVKEEDWKYTNVTPIARTTFLPVWVERDTRLAAGDLSPFIYEETRQSTFVFINGVFQPDLTGPAPTAGISVMSFAEAQACTAHGAAIREHFERHAEEENGFTALNTAFADGVLVLIPANAKVETPIHLLFVSDPDGGYPPAIFPRVLIVAEDNSSATIVESYATGSQEKYLTNSIIDLVVGNGSRLQHYKVQRESNRAFHVASTKVELGPGASYNTTTINFGGALSRHNISVTMDHEGAECWVDGLYMIDGTQHTDTHSVIDHRQPRCASHQLYKGILDGRSRAVFNGKVFVRHGAQQTDAKQTNKNLLLSNEARVDTKPQLEIFADDVKCAHGAAVGQLAEDAIFYLESRGIRPEMARNVLTYGFAEEVIEKIKIDSIKRELDATVLNRLHAELEN